MCGAYRNRNLCFEKVLQRIKNSATIQTQRCDADHTASLINHPVNRKHIMDLNILFENIGSIATSLERIADSLEQRGGNTATVEDKPKRTRRTKAEIEAAEQAVAIPEPQFVAPVVVAPAPIVVAPTPIVVAPTPIVVAPTPVAAPIGVANVDPAYMGFAVEHQFSELNKLVAPYFTTYGQVRDAVLSEAAKHGLGVPFSDESDRSLPGAAYRAATNEARFAIYVAGANAIAGLGL